MAGADFISSVTVSKRRAFVKITGTRSLYTVMDDGEGILAGGNIAEEKSSRLVGPGSTRRRPEPHGFAGDGLVCTCPDNHALYGVCLRLQAD